MYRGAAVCSTRSDFTQIELLASKKVAFFRFQVYNTNHQECHQKERIDMGPMGMPPGPPPELQKKAFDRQLTLAEELDMPVIIHAREAT